MKNAGRTLIASLFFLALFLTPSAHADWMNLTGAETAPNIAEITVLDERVQVALEIYVGDVAAFELLLPDDWLKDGGAGRPSLSERLEQFSAEVFRVETDNGASLSVRLNLLEARLRKDRASPFAGMINPMTRQRVPEAPADKRVLYVELEYPFEGQPEHLTLIRPRNDDGVALVTIGFIAYHDAVPIIDFRYLSAPARVTLDWEDPWYTKFDNPNLKRHHKSALMSFLYVEPKEIRHEILIRARDLQKWTELGLRGADEIAVGDLSRVKDEARAFFATHNPVRIDGRAAQPTSTSAEFLNISVSGLRVVEKEQALDVSTAIIGIILSYPVERIPEHVSVEWDLLDGWNGRVPTMAVDPAGPLPSFITSADPTIEWQNFLLEYEEPEISPVVLDDGRSIGVPVVSAALLGFCVIALVLALRGSSRSRRAWTGLSVVALVAATLSFRIGVVEVNSPFAGPPDEKTSEQIVMNVLENVNHAFLESDPAALQEALGIVVDEHRSGGVATELRRGLAIEVPGGGLARVHTIEDLSVKDIEGLDDSPGFRALAEWTAKASAGHWGHIHRRTIRFRAHMELAEIEGTWKLVGMTVVDAKLQG